MHILVTNDDGVQAPGLLALAQEIHFFPLTQLQLLEPQNVRSMIFVIHRDDLQMSWRSYLFVSSWRWELMVCCSPAVRADAVVKGIALHDIYECDSISNVAYEHISFRELASRGPSPMDVMATTFCEENGIPGLSSFFCAPAFSICCVCSTRVIWFTLHLNGYTAHPQLW